MAEEENGAPPPALRAIETEVVVPAGGLVAIEFPGYVRNVGRALETFGGASALGAMLAGLPSSPPSPTAGASAPPPRLQLRLRPADPLSHPLTSDAPMVGRRALLLRIARPVAPRRRRGGGGAGGGGMEEGDDGDGDGDGASPAPSSPVATVTTAGLVTCAYRFTSLADAQYLPLDGRAGAPSGCGGVAGAGADLSAGGGGGGGEGRDVSSLPPDAQPPAAEAFGAPAPFLMAPPRFLASGEPVEYDFTTGGGDADGGGAGSLSAAASREAAASAAAAVAAAEAAAEVALAAVLRQRLATIEFGAAAVPRAVPLDRAAAYLARRTDRALRSAANTAAAVAAAAAVVAAAAAAPAEAATSTAPAAAAAQGPDEPATSTDSTSILPQLDAFVARLDALFAERRAWLEPVLRERSGLDELAAAAAGAAAEAQAQAPSAAAAAAASARRLRAQRLARDAAALLRAAVYRFRTGPWRHQLVRRGYDPRRDPAGAAPLQGVRASRPPPLAVASAAAADGAVGGGEEDDGARGEGGGGPPGAPPRGSAVRVLCQLLALPDEAEGRLHWRVQARDVVAAAERAAAAAARARAAGGGAGGAPPPPSAASSAPVPAVPSLAPVRNRRVPTETTGWMSQTTLRELSVAAAALYAREAAAGGGGGDGAEEEQQQQQEQEQPGPPPQAMEVDEGAAAAATAQAAGSERRARASREGSAEQQEEDDEDDEGAMEEEEDEGDDGGVEGALDDAAALSTDEGAR